MQLWCWESNHGVWMVAFQMLLISCNIIMHSEFLELFHLLLYHYEEVGGMLEFCDALPTKRHFLYFFQVCIGLSIYPFGFIISFIKYHIIHLFSTTIPYKLTNKHISPIIQTAFIYSLYCMYYSYRHCCTETIGCHFLPCHLYLYLSVASREV